MSASESTSVVYVVDDDPSTLTRVSRMMRAAGYAVKMFTRGAELIEDLGAGSNGCIVAELRMADMSGFDLQQALAHVGCDIPMIFLTGFGDIPAAVRAIRQGAEDFLTKNASPEELLNVVHRAMERDLRQRAERVRLAEIKQRMRSLTPREREVLEHVLQGQRNKQIARELDIHERTVKLHRTNIATKLRVQSVAVMTRLAQEAGALPGVRVDSGRPAPARGESPLLGPAAEALRPPNALKPR
jgi:two-component system response regulator FixJ